MTDLFTPFDTRLDQVIDEVALEIAGGSLTKMTLFDAMKRLHGGSSAEGRWAQRDAYDLLEAGVTRHLLRLPRPVRLDDITALSLLVEQLPTHTVRSEDQIRFQQFSTPADLAALATVLAQPRPDDIVLEPSAGHGALVASLTTVRQLHLNELDPKRREKLALLFKHAKLTGIDGAMLASALDPSLRPSLILMNPPFSRSEGRGVDQFAAVRHLRAALGRLAPGGRLVAIMPDWFTTSARLSKIYDQTFENCTVQTACRLARCYHKQGTSVPVRLYVIDKVPGNIRPAILARSTVAEIAEAVTVVKRAACVSIGVQSGPPIGVQKGPPCSCGDWLMLGACFALLAA